jgi:hypothetical protein
VGWNTRMVHHGPKDLPAPFCGWVDSGGGGAAARVGLDESLRAVAQGGRMCRAAAHETISRTPTWLVVHTPTNGGCGRRTEMRGDEKGRRACESQVLRKDCESRQSQFESLTVSLLLSVGTGVCPLCHLELTGPDDTVGSSSSPPCQRRSVYLSGPQPAQPLGSGVRDNAFLFDPNPSEAPNKQHLLTVVVTPPSPERDAALSSTREREERGATSRGIRVRKSAHCLS